MRGVSGLKSFNQKFMIPSLYKIDSKIEGKQIDMFCSDQLRDLRTDLEASGCNAFAYMNGFIFKCLVFDKSKKTTEL